MGGVRMKVVSVSVVDTRTGEVPEDVIDILEFEDFHDAWEWIYTQREAYSKLTNPTMNLEINEVPTEERAERLYRYAKNLMEIDHGNAN